MTKKEYEYNEFSERLYPDFIKEAQAAYQVTGDVLLRNLLMKKQGEYTIEDYFALPDECRVELIDGVIYNMSAPRAKHQAIIGELFYRFRLHILEHKGKCFPFMAPINVQLDKDNKTMVQPDVIVTCRRDKIRDKVFYGAPDLVIEVLSPSNRPREQGIKYDKYKNAGVREYWIVCPYKKEITVNIFEKEQMPVVYDFQDKIPVHIFNGELVIDFAQLYEEIRFLF